MLSAIDDRPLILTLGLDDELFRTLDRLRCQHFPAAINKLRAHVTLFHHLPGQRLDAIVDLLSEIASMTPAFDLSLPVVRFLGRGVAIEIVSPPLVALRRAIAEAFADELTPQDRQPFRPHVTIQNKVEPPVARRLFEELRDSWTPLAGRGESLRLHRYLGGPWEPLAVFPFA